MRCTGPRLNACLASLDMHMQDATAMQPEGAFFIALTQPDGVPTTAARAEA